MFGLKTFPYSEDLIFFNMKNYCYSDLGGQMVRQMHPMGAENMNGGEYQLIIFLPICTGEAGFLLLQELQQLRV